MAKIMHLVDPKMMMQPTITAPVNPIHRSIVTLDDDMRTVLDRRDLSEEKESQTIQPNLATLFGISQPSQDCIPTQGSQHCQG